MTKFVRGWALHTVHHLDPVTEAQVVTSPGNFIKHLTPGDFEDLLALGAVREPTKAELAAAGVDAKSGSVEKTEDEPKGRGRRSAEKAEATQGDAGDEPSGASEDLMG